MPTHEYNPAADRNLPTFPKATPHPVPDAESVACQVCEPSLPRHAPHTILMTPAKPPQSADAVRLCPKVTGFTYSRESTMPSRPVVCGRPLPCSVHGARNDGDDDAR